MNHNQLKSGFTLVELLVVVLIIGILSAVALPQYDKAVKRSRGVQVTTAAETLVKAANLAYLEDDKEYKRTYQFYSYLGAEAAFTGEQFDIAIPKVTIFKDGLFWLTIYGSNTNSTSVGAVLMDRSTVNTLFALTYQLEKGAIKKISCTGPECKSYFPQYQ